MSASVLTNTSAMVALQTLKSTNSKLAEVNNQVSTGKKIASAKDNASIFAISKIMESDVAGFKAISDSLSLGESTVAVASNAANKVGELLNEIKGKIVSANEENVDRTKIQNEIDLLSGQIQGIVNTAQFNGLNLIDGSQTSINVLSSLDRDSSGAVTARQIQVTAQNLSLTAGTDVIGAETTDGTGTATLTENGGATDSVAFGGFNFLDTSGAAASNVALDPETAGVDNTVATGLAVGDVVSLSIGNQTGSYTVQTNDNSAAVVAGLKNAMAEAGVNTDDFALDLGTGTAAGDITITNNTSNAGIVINMTATRGTGGLSGLAAGTLSVADETNANAALQTIETAIQTVTDAQAAFGTTEKRIEIQSSFMSSLVDSFKAGIGSLVDADLEEASARLQALQVQQQLGVQALSIANQSPQTILSLFR